MLLEKLKENIFVMNHEYYNTEYTVEYNGKKWNRATCFSKDQTRLYFKDKETGKNVCIMTGEVIFYKNGE